MTTAATAAATTPVASTMLASINPANGETVGEVPMTPVSEIPAIVSCARGAQKAWRSRSLRERADLLKHGGESILKRVEEHALLLTREMGKPLADSRGEVTNCGKSLAEGTILESIIEALQPETLEDEHTTSQLRYDPLGVCAAIAPWNFPMAMPHCMVIPALMAGNTVVLKPSEETPLIAQAYVDALSEHLPQDVLQVIHGADQQGKALVEADVDLIAFTGSRETGKKIMQAAAGGLKRLVLELGGKDPMIVLKDADIDQAAQFAARNSFRNAGQVCVSTERIYVDESIAEQFEEAMIRHTKELKVGEGTDEGVQIGPMINARQRDHVLRQVDDAVKRGARVRFGGEGHHDNYILPTIISSVDHTFPIMIDETFGPVTCIARFTSDDDAIDLANDTRFGLGAVVFGEPTHAAQIAAHLDAGMIGINKSCGGASGCPWVGAKESGFGFHSGKAGHRQFAQVRVVSMPKQ
jgi:acyl-CoA reductase-like NAD-dependent aldehyde dehydrogenase